MKKPALKFFTLFGLYLLLAPSVFAQERVPGQESDELLPAALTLLLPLGLLLLISSAMPEKKAPSAAINLLVVWSVALLAYFGVGFAFNFGGIAQVSPRQDLAGLYWEWYPLDQSVDVNIARLWGVIALRGWALSGESTNSGVLLLFLSHVSLVGVAAMIPAGTLLQRGRGGAALVSALLVGAVIYPVASNWLWGGGWLANLGASLDLGHGLVDFGGAGSVFLLGGAVALAALIVFRPTQQDDAIPADVKPHSHESWDDETYFATTPMPSAYLPILGVLGAGLILAGWFGAAAAVHNPTAVNFSSVQVAAGGLLAAMSAALTSAAYSWFTTQDFDPLMAARGMVAGLIVAVAGAPFIPLWILILSGLLMGLLVPLLIYLFDQKLPLRDSLGMLTTFGISAIASLLLAGIFSDGQSGQGWNRIGLVEYAGVNGQGVSGFVVASGFTPDWPGQIQAQLLGVGVILVWGVLTAFILFQLYAVAANIWAHTQIEPSPDAAPSDETPAKDISPLSSKLSSDEPNDETTSA